jgi:SAM-dependent methyltransferase
MVNKWLYPHFPTLRQALSQRWYDYISTLVKDASLTFINYGYAEDGDHLALSAEDEANRYPIQLYHHVASAVDWTGRSALEVGSGRGGGAYYVQRRFNPQSMIGLELAARAVEFCQRHYAAAGLSFIRGDAQQLQFAADTFDIVLNVESALHYPNVERFYCEVVRVLKPGGYFLYADIRYQEEVEAWRGQLQNTGLKLLKEENITPQVVWALALDQERKRRLINRYVPKLLHKPFNMFAGMEGAGLAPHGERIYLNFLFRKE